jgi:hypothetical protein
MHVGFLVGKPERNRPLGRRRHRRIILKWILDGMEWYGLADVAEDRDQWRVLVNMIMNLRALENIGKFLNSGTIGGFSRRI